SFEEEENKSPVRREYAKGRSAEAPGRERKRAGGGRPVRRSETPSDAGEQPAGRRTARPEKRSAGTTGRAAGKKPRAEESAEVRLNKFLADAGIAARRKADELIREGVVKVNRETVTEPGTKVHPSDLVTVRGEPVSAEK